MGDRVRVGEILAAIGAIGLAVLLGFGAWYQFDGGVTNSNTTDGSPAFAALGIEGAVGSRHLGWFVLLLCFASAASGLTYLFRVLTARTTERPMLQAPIAYAFSLIAFVVLALRLFLGNPTYEFSSSELGVQAPDGAAAFELTAPLDVALGGWLGLLCVALIVIGTWAAMADDRTQSKGARARTERLLSGVPTRPVPAAAPAAPAEPQAAVVADDAVPTDPVNPSIRPSGGPA